MSQERILVDSCTYFRLALDKRPLLGVEFGAGKYCLFIVEELEKEYNNSPRLQNKFDWMMEKELVQNRTNTIQIKGKEYKDIDNANSYIRGLAKGKGLSWADSRALATAHVLGITLVSDDSGVISMAEALDIKNMSSLDLLRLMFDEKHIKYELVKRIVAYWHYNEDLPMGKSQLKTYYKKLFGEEPPDENYEEE